jgi:hypothetical protein
LSREQLADDPAEHLTGRHAAPAGCGFQLHRLPPGQQKGQFDDFLIGSSSVGGYDIEQRLHGVTCPGRRVRRIRTAGVTGHNDPLNNPFGPAQEAS